LVLAAMGLAFPTFLNFRSSGSWSSWSTACLITVC
jgi:hypothetical protein